MKQFDQTEEMSKLGRIAQALCVTAFQQFRRGVAQIATQKEEGAEVQLPADLLLSKVLNQQFGLEWPTRRVVDEEEPRTHQWLDDRIGEVFGMGDALDGSSVFQLDNMLDEDEPVSGWGNTLGLIRNGEILAAVMAQPGLRQLWYGCKGAPGCSHLKGADYDEFITTGVLGRAKLINRDSSVKPGDYEQSLVLSLPQSGKMSAEDVDRLALIRKQLHAAKLLGNEGSAGCAVGNIGNVLTGKYAAYFNIGGGQPWDVAVPSFLLELAGGKVTTIEGKKITWGAKKEKLLAARDPWTHERLLRVI